MEKEFKTIEEQIEILKNRNLIVDENQAKKIFKENNYYYVINGYKDLFIDKSKSEETYKQNAELKEIYSLYKFDIDLRMIFLKYTLLLERKFDTYIAYEFSKKYGHKDYLKENNFENTQKNNIRIVKLIHDINTNMMEQLNNGNKMLNHYINQYGYVPLWVLIRIVTFGQVSKLYSLMKQTDQNNIARNFSVREKNLKIYINNLAIIRNICAHDEKLFDIRLKKSISITNIHTKYNLSLKNVSYCNGFKDLFSIVIIFKELLDYDEFEEFYNEIIKLIEKLEKNIHSIKFENILNKMGFPINYKELLDEQ